MSIQQLNQKRQHRILALFDGNLHRALGGGEKGTGTDSSGESGLDTFCHGCAPLDRKSHDGQSENVRLGNRRIHAGAGIKVHQFANGRQAEEGHQDFRRYAGWLQHGKAGRGEVTILFRHDDGGETADRANGGVQHIAAPHMPCPTAGRVGAVKQCCAKTATAFDIADFDIVETVAFLGAEPVAARFGYIGNRAAITPE